MLTYIIVDTLFAFLVISVFINMYFKLVKRETVYKDLNTIFQQISEIILHLDKTDKAFTNLTNNLDRIAEVVSSLLPKEIANTKEPEVKVPTKRSRKKKIVE